jgi:predicted nucleic acid-binding protein
MSSSGIDGIIDTTILIHLFRRNKNAITWLATQSNLGVTTISRLEFIYGARGRSAMMAAIQLLNTFRTIPLSEADQKWAEQQLIKYRLSHGVEINDSLIASVSHRLQMPLYTQNIKDFQKLLPAVLVVRPFVA